MLDEFLKDEFFAQADPEEEEMDLPAEDDDMDDEDDLDLPSEDEEM